MGRLLRGIGAFALSLWILNWFERYPDSNKHIWNTCIGDFSNVHNSIPRW